MTSRPRPIRALTAVAIFAACMLFELVGVNAQSGAYNPAVEGKLWKQLLPWGLNTGPNGEIIWADRRDLNNIPGSDPDARIDTGDLNVYFDPIYQSLGPYGNQAGDPTSMEAAEIDFARLVNQGECTFSHEFDYDIHWSIYWPQVRICKGPEFPVGSGTFARLPPAPGRLLNPVGLATSGKKVFVTDLFNHRVQAFDFFGNFQPMKYPIGNGIPGANFYDYDQQYPGLNYRPYASYPGFENDGFSGYQLSSPAGLAVDARTISGNEAPRLLIADSENYRVALFNDDGSPAFLDGSSPVHVELPIPQNGAGQPVLDGDDPITGQPYRFKPDQVAISSGAVIRNPLLQQPILSGDPDFNKRIVVADRVHCLVAIMDVGFNLIKTLPPALPNPVQHDACQDGGEFNQNTPLPGEFRTITGVKVDANGTIYIADNAANAIRVFDRNGNPIASIGEPGGTNPGAQGDLLGPVGVFIDEKFNRLGVIDQGHGRAVFYDLANGPGNVTFEFQIDTTVAVDDFPMGVIMQYGAAEDGLDPKGRIMVTDPYRRRMLRWELPELVITNQTADITNYSVNPRTGVGSFDVVVPFQKLSPVFDVLVDIQPQVPCQGGNGRANCVRVVANSITPTVASRPDITHGTLIHYTFQFTTSRDEAKFNITAIGCAVNGCATPTVRAPAVEALARALCTDCVANHEIFFDGTEDPAQLVPTPPTVTDADGHQITGWYNQPVYVRITPDNSGVVGENDPNEIVAIGWSYGGVSNVNYEQGLTEVTVPNGEFLDVPVGLTGISWVTYRPITRGGAAGAPVVVVLPVDLAPPAMSFNAWPTPSGVNGPHDWYNAPVSVSYTMRDPHSGPQIPSGGTTVSFTQEGRDQFVSLTIADRVGNFSEVRSDDRTRGGKPVYIDMRPPTFGDGLITFQLQATGTDATGHFVDIAANQLFANVVDPKLADGSTGSGAVTSSVGNRAALKVRDGGTIYFDAIDHAGNASVGQATLIVHPPPPGLTTISVVGGTFVYDGNPHPASCVVTAGDRTTFPGTLRYSPVDAAPVNVGTVTAHCEFAGSGIYQPATSRSAAITITPRPITIRTTSQTILETSPIPSFPFVIAPGSLGLVGGDTFSGALGGIPTLAVPGVYHLNIGTVTAGSNYQITLLPATLTIQSVNAPPVAVADVRTSLAGAPVTIDVVSNDSDPDGTQAALKVVAFTQPLLGAVQGVVTQVGEDFLVFTPAPGFAGVVTFNYTIEDPQGARASTTVTITVTALPPCNIAGYTTYSQGGWGNNGAPGRLMQQHFAQVYPLGYVIIGGTHTLKFIGAAAITNFLPSGGTPAMLTASLVNPTSSSAGNFAAQVLALRLAVDYSAAGVLKSGLGSLVMVSGPFAGKTVNQILATANAVLGGSSSALPSGMSVSQLNSIVESLNLNFHEGTTNNGLLRCGSGSAPANAAPIALDNSASTVKGQPKTIAVLSNDSDPNNDALTITSFTQPSSSKGSVVLNPNGTFTFTPRPDATGTATFTYTISDGKGGTDTATVTITITGHSDDDDCDHDRGRNGHRDGDNCDHDRTVKHHYDGDGCDHDRSKKGHRDGDNCEHDRHDGSHRDRNDDYRDRDDDHGRG